MKFLWRLHQNEFWDEVDPEHTRALYIPKTASVEYLNKREDPPGSQMWSLLLFRICLLLVHHKYWILEKHDLVSENRMIASRTKASSCSTMWWAVPKVTPHFYLHPTACSCRIKYIPGSDISCK